ncbi:MAG: DUF177 domain-containing protein [Endomicrobiales bacterium]|nr:DUF177 domain-containing protein [Endomicrobiales bacterium]
MKNLQIDVSGLKDLEKIEQSVEECRLNSLQESVSAHTLKADFSITKNADSFLLNGSVSGQIEISCSRCLETFRLPITAKLNKVYPESTVLIDVEEEIRQEVILTIPVKPLCGEQCKGLCQICGINRNKGTCNCRQEFHDPRWDDLQKIIK